MSKQPATDSLAAGCHLRRSRCRYPQRHVLLISGAQAVDYGRYGPCSHTTSGDPLKPRTPRKLRSTLLAGLTLSAVALVPLVGSAALTNDGSFGIRAINSDDASISAIRGLPLGAVTDPVDSEAPSTEPAEEPSSQPDDLTTRLTVDTSKSGCNRAMGITVVGGDTRTGQTTPTEGTIDWGDGTRGSTLQPYSFTHSYSSGGIYEVSIKGTLGGLTNNQKFVNCVTSVDHFAKDSGILSISGLFSGSQIVKKVAAPPQSVTNASSLFNGSTFNGDTSDWTLPNLRTASAMFYRSSFNGDLSKLNPRSLEIAGTMFTESAYDGTQGSIANWNTSNLQSMIYMFSGTAFNTDISSWNVSKVRLFEGAFYKASLFNQPIGKWDVESGTSFSAMFRNATAFNQDLSSWRPINAVYMATMFNEAKAFSQDISSWSTSTTKVTSYDDFYLNSGLSASQVPTRFR